MVVPRDSNAILLSPEGDDCEHLNYSRGWALRSFSPFQSLVKARPGRFVHRDGREILRIRFVTMPERNAKGVDYVFASDISFVD
ncbi:hypothetical protein JCM18882A_23470 [Brevibacterium metallidurans]|uniref:Uncharacterized protein n=2 Tax=Brevibacterium TaxID=1696 RepID=A0ABP9U4D5_9MICO